VFTARDCRGYNRPHPTKRLDASNIVRALSLCESSVPLTLGERARAVVWVHSQWGGETPRDLAPAPEEPSTALPQRPVTAPTLLTAAAAASAAEALSSDRLFSNDFLNQHPVLMEYMSQAESERGALFMDDEGGPVVADRRPPARPRASLAHRLRATTAVMTARGSMDVHELVRGKAAKLRRPFPPETRFVLPSPRGVWCDAAVVVVALFIGNAQPRRTQLCISEAGSSDGDPRWCVSDGVVVVTRSRR